MLADQFAEFQQHEVYRLMTPGYRVAVETLSAAIQVAHRFNLDRDATMMIQNLSTMEPRHFLSALSICRLPFSPMWVEFAWKDRADWLVAAAARGMTVSHNPMEGQPRRLGFLLTDVRAPEGHFILAHPAWNAPTDTDLPGDRNPAIEMGKNCLMIDVNETLTRPDVVQHAYQSFVKDNPEGHSESYLRNLAVLEARVAHIPAPGCELLWQEYKKLPRQTYERILEAARFDLAGEWRFILAMLIAINSRNMMAYGDEETYAKLNKSRISKGRPPLLSHRPIKLSLSKVQRNRMARGYVDRKSPEAHWVMGHFKRKPSGLYWWSPHVRSGEPTNMRERIVTT